jgi:hypothetical protein
MHYVYAWALHQYGAFGAFSVCFVDHDSVVWTT